MKLISMSDFCLQLLNENAPYNEVKMLTQISNYANLLKQPLTLGMFVPCDEDGNVLEEPKTWSAYQLDKCYCDKCLEETKMCDEYKEAKEKVLFEGFELVEKREVYDSINGLSINLDTLTFQIEGSLGVGGGYLLNETIEDLTKLELKLTKSAIKQIGL